MATRPASGWSLKALRENTSGNVLAIGAASVLPILAVIGGAVDMSRNYMVMTRLQQACDAGVLAGRKAVGANLYNANAAAQATKMFNANYPRSYAGSYDVSFAPTSPDNGTTVNGLAQASVPTAIMKIFGYEKQDLTVDCAATFQITNTDITMVLDVTASMSDPISDGAGGTISRLAALKKATKNFYDTMEAAKVNSSARIRYALVPYSQTVNAARLVKARDASFIVGGNPADTVAFQTRRPVYEYDIPNNVVETRTESLSQADARECYDLYAANQGIQNYWYPSNDGYSNGQNATKSGDTLGRYTFSFQSWNGSTARPDTSKTGRSWWKTCVRTVTRTATQYSKGTTYDRNALNANFVRYEYEQVATPIHGYYNSLDNGSRVVRPSDRAYQTDQWYGCLLEPDTVSADNVTFDSSAGRITPIGAKDLNIDLIPQTDAERWKPLWQEINFHRKGNPDKVNITNPNSGWGSTWWGCPIPATNLSTMSKKGFYDYADSLVTAGNTYHDVGLLWGARLASPNGIFSANVNATAPNNGFVSRNLIFMTDGEMANFPWAASAYGTEWNDHKILNWAGATWDSNGLMARQRQNHTARFRALCEAVKAKNIRLWVVAFATNLDSNLIACASPNSAFVSTNATQLNDNFERIAKSMTDLRIVQ